MLLIGQPSSAARMGKMIGEAGLRETIWVGRGIERMVAYLISPIAEIVEQGLVVWVKRGLCKEEKVWGVSVQHRDDVDKGGAVSPRLLCVDSEEREWGVRQAGIWVTAKSCGLVCLRRDREIRRGKCKGGSCPICRSVKYGTGGEGRWFSGSSGGKGPVL